jgi:phosphatidylserine/phosphatidylglycerophosphate/cardiolipin synthase-like enzyme
VNGLGLTDVSLADLKDVVRAIVTGHLSCPLTRAGLQAAGFGHIADIADVLTKFDEPGTAISLVVADREHRPVPRLELVWTGPEPRVSESRDTAVVVRQLFADARQRVLIAGFSFDHGADIFRPLHAVMRDHGVVVDVFLDIPRQERTEGDTDAFAAEAVDSFFRKNWPFGDPSPTVYYDPRTVAPGSRASLHAKCIVVDDRKALVTSANFTDRGQSRNIEVGVLVEDSGFASRLAGQWRGLVEAGLVVPVLR